MINALYLIYLQNKKKFNIDILERNSTNFSKDDLHPSNNLSQALLKYYTIKHYGRFMYIMSEVKNFKIQYYADNQIFGIVEFRNLKKDYKFNKIFNVFLSNLGKENYELVLENNDSIWVTIFFNKLIWR